MTRLRFFVLAVIPFIFPFIVWAQESVIHPADAVHDGNYVRVAQTIQVFGKVTKDAVLIGKDVTITGPIEGDLIIVAETAAIRSTVGGNVRVLAATATLDGDVGKNVTVMAGKVGMASTARVGWDLFAIANSIDLQGNVNGGVWARGQHMTLAAQVAKDADIGTRQPLSVAANTQVKGTLKYSGVEQAVIAPGSQMANFQYSPTAKKGGAALFDRTRLFRSLVFLFGAWVVGGVLLALYEPWLNACADRLRARPLATLGWGVVGVIATPILVAIFGVTLIGIPLAILLALAYGVVVYCARMIVGYGVGRIIQTRMGVPWPSIVVMVIGTGVYVLLINIPLVGPILGLLGTTLAFGVVAQTLIKPV